VLIGCMDIAFSCRLYLPGGLAGRLTRESATGVEGRLESCWTRTRAGYVGPRPVGAMVRSARADLA
jgi:hypothetical protein